VILFREGNNHGKKEKSLAQEEPSSSSSQIAYQAQKENDQEEQ
jgi:hypothetical protein